MKMSRRDGLCVLLCLLVCDVSAEGTRESAGPVALAYWLKGEATLAVPSEERRPLRLFDRLPAGATLEVGPGSRLALAFANGRRYELGERSRATLGPADLSLRSGPVRSLRSVPPLLRLLPIAEEEGPGLRAGAVRIRAERIAGLYPRGWAAALAGATVLRFNPVDGGGKYQIEIQNRQGNAVFMQETAITEVTVPAGLLKPGMRYDWTVRTVERVGPVARGEAGFVTLPADIAEAREALRRAVGREEGDPSQALLADIDLGLGMLVEARDELRLALGGTSEDAALRAVLADLERKLQDDDDPAKPDPGIVVEEVAPASAAESAGIRPGDVLLCWFREDGSDGPLGSPFHFGQVVIEQAPRGAVTLQGRREERDRQWTVEPGSWGIRARPTFAADLLKLYQEGRERIAAGDLETGAESWRSAVQIAARQENPLRAAWLQGRLARALAEAKRWPEADAAWEAAVQRVEKSQPPAAAQLLHDWGDMLLLLNEWEHAAEIYRRALALQPEESLAAALELNSLAITTIRRRDLATAEDLYRKAYSLRKRLAPGSLELASSEKNLAMVAGQQGRLDNAEEHLKEALKIQERLAPESLDVAPTLITMGNVALERGDLITAEEHYRHALVITERLDPEGPSLATTVGNLGRINMARGNLAVAEENFRRALAIETKRNPESIDVARHLNYLGKLAERQGDLAAAEEYHRRALAIREKLAPGAPDSLINLGIVERQRGNLKRADEYFRRALEIEERIAPESGQHAAFLLEWALVAIDRGDLATAEQLHIRALAILEKLAPDSLDVSDALENLGNIAWERSDMVRAEDFYRRSFAIRERLTPGSKRLGRALNKLGQIHRRFGRRELAAQYFCDALDAFDRQREKLGGPSEQRSSFGGSIAEAYRDCAAALVEIGRPEEAFHALERGRARSFLELLADRDLRFDLPPDLERERRETDAEYDRTQAALEHLSPVRDQAEIDRRLVRLRELRVRQAEIATKVRQASPRTAALSNPQPLDLAAARNTLDAGTLLLAWSIGHDRSLLFALLPAGSPEPGFEIFPLPVTEKDLRQRVTAFRNLLQRADSDRTALTAQARDLYDLLLRPAEGRIAASDRLLVLPDGPLHTLPFAVLVRNGRYIAEQKPIHTALSATVYAQLRTTRRQGAPGPVTLAAFGDPRYPRVHGPADAATLRDPDVRAAAGRGLALTPLPASREEVRSIAALFPQTKTFLGPEATEEQAKLVGKEARYLHFACHGLLDERSPMNSALALTIPESPEKGQDNGLLQAWEIFERVRLDADLVTLSACDSALGPEMGGEGLLGLTQAFQYAGARSVLASLWSVSDLSTADLMKRFYGHLRARKSKDEALQAAQVELIRSSKFSHPYYWAAFQLVGDWK